MIIRGALLVGAAAGVLMFTGQAGAVSTTNEAGFVMGDPSSGKLMPYYQFSTGHCDENANGTIDPDENNVTTDCGIDADCSSGAKCVAGAGNLASILGFENTKLNVTGGADIFVHIEVFDKLSNPVFSKVVCVTQGDLGYVVLQQKAPSADQLADVANRCGPDSPRPQADPVCKVTIVSQEIEGIPSQGYITLAARPARENPDVEFDRRCEFGVDNGLFDETPDQSNPGELYAWGVLQDVSEGFFATEIPVVSAGVNFQAGGAVSATEPCNIVTDDGRKVSSVNAAAAFEDAGAGSACLVDTSALATGTFFGGLISADRRVGARFDCNPANGSASTLVFWANGNYSPGSIKIIARGEDEGCFDGSFIADKEVNVIDLCKLAPVRASANAGEFRGAVEFLTPGTSDVDGFFMFSLISQEGAHHVLTQLPYNTGEDTANDAVSVVCPAVVR